MENLKSQPKHTHVPSDQLDVLRDAQRFFKADMSSEVSTASVEIAQHERTASGAIELGWDYLETKKALTTDVIDMGFTEWPRHIQSRVQERINSINSSRGSKPLVEAGNIDITFLRHLADIDWTSEASSDNIDAWPDEMHPDIKMLAEIEAKLRVLSSDERLRQKVGEITAEQTEIMRAAYDFHRKEKQIEAIADKVANMRARAAEKNRPLTPGQQSHLERLLVNQEDITRNLYKNNLHTDVLQDIVAEVERIDRKELRRQYESGLVLTDQMRQIIHEVLPSIVRGNPSLFVGETGGAKTALAKVLSRVYMGKEPEIVSGYSDVNGYQLMGKTGLTTKEGATVSEFIDGPVVTAMQEGRVLILDEVNAMPPEFLKRLNEIIQLRPGDIFTVQEDSGKQVKIKSGFAVIATANDKSRRYKGVHQLSAEFKNRFAANSYRVVYPDADLPVGENPIDNLKIAYASVSDRSGNIMFEEGTEVLETFVKAAHITQRLYSHYISEGLSPEERDVVGSDRLRESGATGLDDNVLAPRTMAAILEKVVNSRGGLKLGEALDRWVVSIDNKHDRQVIRTIFTTHNLLDKTDKSSPGVR